MDNLPNEMLRHIFSLLPIKDKLRLEIVCKKWRYILLILWQQITGLKLSFDNRESINVVCYTDDKIVGRFNDHTHSSYVWCLEENIRILINRCGIYLKDFEIDFSKIRCFRLSVLNLVAYECKNLRKVKFEGLDLWPIASVRNMFTVYSVFGSIVGLNTLQHLTLLYPDNQPICFNISPVLGDVISSMANLTHLILINSEMNDSLFIPLCRQLADTLQSFCFKERYCYVRRDNLAAGLKLLKNLKHLNLGCCLPSGTYDTVAMLVDDEMLQNISVHCRNLESLNIHGALFVTTEGVGALVNVETGVHSIRHLGIVSCRGVDNSLIRFLRRRLHGPRITIHVYLTSITPGYMKYFQRRYHFEMIYQQPSLGLTEVFFGEHSDCYCKQSEVEDADSSDTDTD